MNVRRGDLEGLAARPIYVETIIGEAMFSAPAYRVYFLSGSAVLSRDIHCGDDALAIEQAERLFPEGIVEVWQANRLVTRLENIAAAE